MSCLFHIIPYMIVLCVLIFIWIICGLCQCKQIYWIPTEKFIQFRLYKLSNEILIKIEKQIIQRERDINRHSILDKVRFFFLYLNSRQRHHISSIKKKIFCFDALYVCKWDEIVHNRSYNARTFICSHIINTKKN